MPTQADYPCMLAQPFTPKRVKSWPVAVELKIDGMRGFITVKHATEKDEKTGEEIPVYDVQTTSREGNVWTSVRKVEDALLDVFAESNLKEDYVFDGEFYCGSFKKTQSQIKKKDVEAEDAVFIIFDCFPLSQHNEVGTPDGYTERRLRLLDFFKAANLEQLKKLQLSRSVLAQNVDEVNALYVQARAMGKEGVVIKQLEGDLAKWKGKRGNGWLKIKDRETIDLKIVGAAPGKPGLKYEKTLGNLIVELPEREKREAAGLMLTCDVGVGLTDEERDAFWAMHQAGTLAGKIVELSFHERTPDGSLRHPVFERIRDDKTKPD